MNKKFWGLLCLCMFLPLMAACGQPVQQMVRHSSLTSDSLYTDQQPSPTPPLSIAQQAITPTPVGSGSSVPVGPAPYGPPPAQTALETQLTQELFNQINTDRAALGLYPYTWNATLAAGALLHSWNMYHCGFSHTCPNGEDQCTRIANEGFAGYSDCGECIGLAGPSSPPWKNVYAVQESMMAEGPTGWHYIHLTSKTLHRIGVGVYVDPTGWVWFTEDMVS